MLDIHAQNGAIEDLQTAQLRQRAEESQNVADETRATIVLVTLCATLVLAIVGTIITRDIAGPLNRITSVAERITRGDLSDNVANNGRYDEVGVLERSFSKMSTSLRSMANAAKQIASSDLRVQLQAQSPEDELGSALVTMVANLRRSTAELSDGVNVLASSVSEILASTTQVAAGAAEIGTLST